MVMVIMVMRPPNRRRALHFALTVAGWVGHAGRELASQAGRQAGRQEAGR